MSLAVMYLDGDGFKEVNDGCGHSTGDALLKLVGERLLSVVRGYDAVARLGGDEFALLIEDIGEDIDPSRVRRARDQRAGRADVGGSGLSQRHGEHGRRHVSRLGQHRRTAAIGC
jgi:diguanylate cyclase (GGDEF)-like protein